MQRREREKIWLILLSYHRFPMRVYLAGRFEYSYFLKGLCHKRFRFFPDLSLYFYHKRLIFSFFLISVFWPRKEVISERVNLKKPSIVLF